MNLRRGQSSIVLPAILVGGAAFSSSGVVVAHQRYRDEFATSHSDWFRFAGWYVFGHAGAGAALLALTVAYATMRARAPLSQWAPLVYLLSYGLVGLAFLVILESAGKGETSDEVIYTLVSGSVIVLLPVTALSAAGLLWAARQKGPSN